MFQLTCLGDVTRFRCVGCSTGFETEAMPGLSCKACGDLLEWIPGHSVSTGSLLPPPQDFTMWRYAAMLPQIDEGGIVSLSEGGTPLHYADGLAEATGVEELFLKNEGKNPTGSFKDRGMSVALTAAKACGVKVAVCASTGNTASSMSAYCARANIRSIVLVPRGKVAKAKLRQCAAYGGTIAEVNGNFDMALDLVKQTAGIEGAAVMNSINPFRIEGQKTGAFEVCDQLSSAPDWLVIPVGNGGNITSYWKGFNEFRQMGVISSLPKMIGVQAEGAAPIVHAFAEERETVRFVEKPETEATAIRIGRPANWKRALAAIRDSGGAAVSVTDNEIKSARRLISEKEGMLVELASASTVAAVKKVASKGLIRKGETVVCVATGNGLKDLDADIEFTASPVSTVGDISGLIGTI